MEPLTESIQTTLSDALFTTEEILILKQMIGPLVASAALHKSNGGTSARPQQQKRLRRFDHEDLPEIWDC